MTLYTPSPNKKLVELVELLDIPLSYYEKAVLRYKSLSEWFKRPESSIARFDPLVFPQGSFRIGTVIRPIMVDDEYDLDVVCQLLLLNKFDLSQQELKKIVGAEIQAYAKARGIKAPVVDGKRAWRLDYADDVNFHIDILACVPEDESVVRELVARCKVRPDLAKTAIALTCKSHPRYDVRTLDWPTSNPIGYASWFEGRMGMIAAERRLQILNEGRYSSVEEVPTYELKTPLQRAAQLLKRHRDVMFCEDADLKPISMLITTLAAQAYSGEQDVYGALTSILRRMSEFVNAHSPRVPNPVNPREDFADKWATNSELEANFWAWHTQACHDFETIATTSDVKTLRVLSENRLHLPLTEVKAQALIGAVPVPAAAPAVVLGRAPSPWGDE